MLGRPVSEGISEGGPEGNTTIILGWLSKRNNHYQPRK